MTRYRRAKHMQCPVMCQMDRAACKMMEEESWEEAINMLALEKFLRRSKRRILSKAGEAP